MPVDRQRGLGEWAGKGSMAFAPVRELGVVRAPAAEHRREARRHQQHVALAQRHVQPLGQMQDHVAARLGAAQLHKAQVLGGDVRLQRQVELGQAPALAPLAQQFAYGLSGCGHDHRPTLAPGGAAQQLPGR